MLLRLMLLLLFDLDVVVDVFLMSSFLDFFCFAPVLSLLMFWYWVVDGDTGRVGSGMDWRW